jgi:hypothetical protein
MVAKAYRKIGTDSPNTQQKCNVGYHKKRQKASSGDDLGNHWFGKRAGLLSAAYFPHIVEHMGGSPNWRLCQQQMQALANRAIQTSPQAFIETKLKMCIPFDKKA